MGQWEIIKILRRNGGRTTTNVLMESSGISNSSVNQSLRRMEKHGEIRREITGGGKPTIVEMI